MSQPIFDRKKHRQEVESLRADNRQKDMNLSRDYVTEWRTYIAEPLAIAFLCHDSAKLMRAWLCARCSIGCSGRWGSSGRKWRNCGMRYKLLTCVLIGLSALCWTSCASSRKATSSLQLTAYGLHETRDTVREQVMVAVHDTIREVTTITVQTNDAGDTVKVVQITDRDRARNREAVRDKEERLVVKTDTVYIEKRDSSLRLSSLGAYGLQEDGTPTISGKLSAVSKILKWIFALICAVVVLILVIRFLKTR